MAVTSAGWQSLAKVPEVVNGQYSIAFNDKTNELFAIQSSANNCRLIEYSFNSDTWNEIRMNNPFRYRHREDCTFTYESIDRPTSTIDCEHNVIYLCFWEEGGPDWWNRSLNASTRYLATLQIVNDANEIKKAVSQSSEVGTVAGMANALKMTIIGRELHLTGGCFHTVILIGDEVNSDIVPESSTHLSEDFDDHGMVKVNDKILIFGGMRLRESIADLTKSVHQFDTVRREWSKLPIEIAEALLGIGCVSVLNEQFVLLIGGEKVQVEGSAEGRSQIQIYSVPDQAISASNVQSPIKGATQAVAIRDISKESKSVIGYIRKEWKECGIADHLFPSRDVLKMIVARYHNEFVHIFDSSPDADGSHYRINVDDILQ